MPHRVTNFLRASTENISSIKSTVARARNSREIQDRQSSYAASISDDDGASVRSHVVDQTAHRKKHRRLSWSFGRVTKDLQEQADASVDWSVESPPVLFLGDAEHSTGALVSGQMLLVVRDEMVDMESFEATLNLHVVQKKPFQNHCTECTNQFTELKHWSFLGHPTTLQKGIHYFPFSALLEGHLPASMDTPLVCISYEFKAEALRTRSPCASTGSLAPLKFERNIEVKRALPESELPHHSVRIFPPTNIKAGANFMQVIHPTGKNTVSMRLDGVSTKDEKSKSIEIWRLKKVTWKLEETIKTIAPACEKHSPHSDTGGAKKGIQRVDSRVLGEKSLVDGWKADYYTNDGTVEFELDYGMVHQKHHQGSRYACDSKSRDGTEVSHNLMVELVVSREWAPLNKPQLVTQTGTGRILRMHYLLSMTEFPGLGISWDNESPPVYQDVPPSPPAYPNESPVDYESLELLDAARNSDEER